MTKQDFIRLALYHWANTPGMTLHQAYAVAKAYAAQRGMTTVPSYPRIHEAKVNYERTLEAA